MNLFQGIKATIARGLKPITFSSAGGGNAIGSYGGSNYSAGWNWGLPGTNRDFAADAGILWLNSTVGICLNAYISTIHAAPLCVKQQKGKNKEIVPNHPLTELIRRPNPYYAGSTLWALTMIDYKTGGNAYWFKAPRRDRLGTAEVYYIPASMVRPIWDRESRELIKGYQYTVNGKPEFRSVDQVIHFKYAGDPYTMGRVGMSPLMSVLCSIVGVNDAETYMASIMRNLGIPGVIIIPDPVLWADGQGLVVNEQEVKDKFTAQVSGDKRGGTAVMSLPVKLDKLAFSPEDLAIDTLHSIPVQTVCAAMDVDPMVVHLPSQNRTYDNYEVAIRDFWTRAVKPMHANFAETLDLHLLDEYTDDNTISAEWDYDDVEPLQGDVYAKRKDARENYKAGGITLNEYRIEIGEESLGPDGDVFYEPPVAGQIAVMRDESFAEATPPGADAGNGSQSPQDRALVGAGASSGGNGSRGGNGRNGRGNQ